MSNISNTPEKKIEELEGMLVLMQRELEALKNDKVEKKQEKPDIFKKYQERLSKAQEEVIGILKEMTDEGIQAASTTITVAKFDGEGNGIGTSAFGSLDDMNEDGLAAALDVFTNPRRIAIIKLLIPKAMTGTEISQNTGLVGGQLYHHLSCLENAKLIIKQNDKYRTCGDAQALLCGLSSAVAGWI